MNKSAHVTRWINSLAIAEKTHSTSRNCHFSSLIPIKTSLQSFGVKGEKSKESKFKTPIHSSFNEFYNALSNPIWSSG